MKKKPKKSAPVPADLIMKQIRWPADWVAHIDAVRGDVPFADYVREAVMDKAGRPKGLSEIRTPGRPVKEE